MMMRRGVVVAAVLILAGRAVPDLQAQVPGEDLGTASIQFGSVKGLTTFEDGTTLESATVVGGAVTLWPFRHLGFRANLLKSGVMDGTNDEFAFAPIAVNDPSVWLFGAELALRYPMVSTAFAWFPYVTAGMGGKIYKWKIANAGDETKAWTLGAGLDARPNFFGPIGLTAELRYWRSDFNWFGHGTHYGDYTNTDCDRQPVDLSCRYDEFGHDFTNNDLVFTAGLGFNF